MEENQERCEGSDTSNKIFRLVNWKHKTVVSLQYHTSPKADMSAGFAEDLDDLKFNFTFLDNNTDLSQLECHLQHHGIEVSCYPQVHLLPAWLQRCYR